MVAILDTAPFNPAPTKAPAAAPAMPPPAPPTMAPDVELAIAFNTVDVTLDKPASRSRSTLAVLPVLSIYC